MRQPAGLFWAGLLFFHSAWASEVVLLTTENFEHLTQASTGSTTGDWFIGECRGLKLVSSSTLVRPMGLVPGAPPAPPAFNERLKT